MLPPNFVPSEGPLQLGCPGAGVEGVRCWATEANKSLCSGCWLKHGLHLSLCSQRLIPWELKSSRYGQMFKLSVLSICITPPCVLNLAWLSPVDEREVCFLACPPVLNWGVSLTKWCIVMGSVNGRVIYGLPTKSIKRITDINSMFTAHFFKWKALFYPSHFRLVGPGGGFCH